MHHRFEVSTKIALYQADGSAVLVIHITSDDYGIPGGHMYADETPEQAMKRELYEETGLKDVAFEQAGFFRHGNGRIILAYVGTTAQTSPVTSQQARSEGDPVWLSKEAFLALSIDPGYRALVLDNWPSDTARR